MRVESSIKNSIMAFISNILIILIGFIAQKIFLSTLGTEYLGLDGLFSNIISMLAVVELGLGTAIIFNLYKPLSTDDRKTINSLIKFYKKSYRIIAFIILILGLAFIPFLKIVVGEINININIYIVYGMFLFDSIISYFLTYKRSILYADQKNYVIMFVHLMSLVVMNIFQILIIVFFKNYYIYLIIKILLRLVENLTLSIIVDKKYPYINTKTAEELDINIKNDIFKKIKALFFHKIGSFIVLGSDNIIISMFFGVAHVGLYSNYYMIIKAIQAILSQIFSSITGSIGNLLATSNKVKVFDIFKKIRFINFLISTIVLVGISMCIQDVVALIFGSEYLLSYYVVIAVAYNAYLQISRLSNNALKDAAGEYYDDRYVPLIESIINIVCSIIFLKIFGLAGVFIGTICSNLLIHLYSYPKIVYKKILEQPIKNYYLLFLKNNILSFLILILTFSICNLINFNNIILNFILHFILSLFIPISIIIILFRKTDEFQYLIYLLKSIFNKIFKVIKKN